MRWDALFSDLAGQADALARVERDNQIADRYRIEAGTVTVRARLRASMGRQLRLQTSTGDALSGIVRQLGSDCLLLDGEKGRESIVALSHVLTVRGLDRAFSADAAESPVDARLGMRSMLRAVARHRSNVAVTLVGTSSVFGVIDRVGADHVDVSTPPARHGSRAVNADTTSVLLSAVVAVTRQAG